MDEPKNILAPSSGADFSLLKTMTPDRFVVRLREAVGEPPRTVRLGWTIFAEQRAAAIASGYTIIAPGDP